MIDVVQERVQRRHALLHARLQPPPLGGGDDARDAVERQDAVDRAGLGIDGEGDAEVDQVALRRRRARPQRLQPDAAMPRAAARAPPTSPRSVLFS